MLEATRAGQSVAKPLQVKPYEAGIGRERESRHIEGVYFDALFETIRNLASYESKS